MRRLRLTWPGDSQATLNFSRKARCWCWRHSGQYGKNEQRFYWKQFFDVFFEQSGSCFRENSGIQACWPLIPNILKEEAPIITSSATQGVGGSFKNRKPIGEVGCCESRMAERIHWWTERWLKLCFLEWLQWLQWSPHTQLLDVVWWSAVVGVVVVWCSGVVVVMCNKCSVVAVVVVVVVWEYVFTTTKTRFPNHDKTLLWTTTRTKDLTTTGKHTIDCLHCQHPHS